MVDNLQVYVSKDRHVLREFIDGKGDIRPCEGQVLQWPKYSRALPVGKQFEFWILSIFFLFSNRNNRSFGLCINYDKSVLIPLNTNEEWTKKMAGILRYIWCGQATNEILRHAFGCKLEEDWYLEAYYKQNWKQVMWKCKFLSKPGRLVHIKLVLNSLPLYYLGLLKMPKVVARKIIALRSQFFWRTNDGGKGISMVKWSLIQEPKQLGGLGVEDPFAENMTLLFKW